jgi:drug/metabolite transporter (DMT)-like permease
MFDRQLLLGVVLSVTAALLFCTKSVILKCAFALGADASQMLALRMAISAPFFLALSWYHERRARKAQASALTTRGLAVISAWGLLGYALCPWLDFQGLQYIPVSLERMVLFAYPTLVVLFAILRGTMHLHLAMAIGLATTYLGVFCTSSDHHLPVSQHATVGILLVAASAVSYAVFLVGANATLRRYGDQRFMAMAITAACLGVCLHGLSQGGIQLFVVRPLVLGYGVLLAIPATVVPAMLTGAGLRLLGPSRFAVVSTIGPLGTVALAMLVLGEQPSALGWLGIALTLGGCLATGLSTSAAPIPGAGTADACARVPPPTPEAAPRLPARGG